MELKDFGIPPGDDWSAFGLVRVFDVDYVRTQRPRHAGNTYIPIGWVVANNPRHRPITNKLAGGKKEAADETPLATFLRELWEEAGIKANPRHTQYLGKVWMPKSRSGGAHWRVFFTTDIGQRKLAQMNGNHPQSGGDRPKFVGLQRFGRLVARGRFQPSHYKHLVQFGAIMHFNATLMAQ